MAITQTYSQNHFSGRSGPETHFVGRVVQVNRFTADRNWSDTLDYSDFRSTKCTEALVWLGPYGVPATHNGMTYIGAGKYGEARDLLPHEQFAWVDCTNLFSDRNGFSLEATVDEFSEQLRLHGPAMQDALMAYRAHVAEQARLTKERQLAAAAEAEAEKKKNIEKAAKKAAKDAELRQVAEKMLARIPAKGTTVTIDGFTGQVFWTGATKYRGTWSARAGIKDARGTVAWVPAEKF